MIPIRTITATDNAHRTNWPFPRDRSTNGATGELTPPCPCSPTCLNSWPLRFGFSLDPSNFSAARASGGRFERPCPVVALANATLEEEYVWVSVRVGVGSNGIQP